MNMILKKTLFWFVVCLILYVILFLFVDRPVDLWVHSLRDTWVFGLGSFLSMFAKSRQTLTASVLCLFIVAVHDSLKGRSKWTKTLLYICLSLIVAKTLGDCLKYLLGRYRPVMLFEHGQYGFHFFAKKWEMLSTPSGHTLRIFSLMIALALSFRRYRYLFFAFAACVGASRFMVTAHYPSDVLFGAFIGVVSAYWTRYYMYKEEFGAV